jgi:hypothetical protein
VGEGDSAQPRSKYPYCGKIKYILLFVLTETCVRNALDLSAFKDIA